MRAGLTSWTGDGQVVDRYRDQVVVASRDQRLDPVGFVGIDRDGEARTITSRTPVHHALQALVGVQEQIDVLEACATAVIVDHPLDAIGIELGVRYSKNASYAGIPLVGSALSDAQAQILRDYSRADRVIVTVPADLEAGGRAVGNTIYLAQVFDGVRLLQRPTGPLLANPGPLTLLADFVVTEPASSHRSRLNGVGDQTMGSASKSRDRVLTDDGPVGLDVWGHE